MSQIENFVSLDDNEVNSIDLPIVLISGKDQTPITTSRKVAEGSNMIKTAIEHDLECKELTLNLVDKDELKLAVEYMEWISSNKPSVVPYGITDTTLKSYLQEWELNYINRVYDNRLLAKLTNAANYLDIKPLLEVCCAKIASLIKGKIYDSNIDQVIASL